MSTSNALRQALLITLVVSLVQFILDVLLQGETQRDAIQERLLIAPVLFLIFFVGAKYSHYRSTRWILGGVGVVLLILLLAFMWPL